MKSSKENSTQNDVSAQVQLQPQEGLALESPMHSPFVQAKLTIGQPDDPFEKEADEMAEQVVQMKAEAPAIVQESSNREAEEERLKPGLSSQISAVQLSGSRGSIEAPQYLQQQLQAQAGKGRALPDKTIGQMEAVFGANFGKVNIHTDSQAIQMNRDLGAHAFTHGQDIFFNEGKYQPGTVEGEKLLAHELTHVVQQTETATPAIQREGPELVPFYILVRAYQPAARRFTGRHLDDSFKEETVVIVATTEGIRLFDGNGRVLVNRTFAFTTPVNIPNGVYSLEGPSGSETLFFYRVYETEDNRIAPALDVATAGEEHTENVTIEDIIEDPETVGGLIDQGRYIFLIVPGSPGGAGAEGFSDQPPDWARRQVEEVEEALQELNGSGGQGGGSTGGAGSESEGSGEGAEAGAGSQGSQESGGERASESGGASLPDRIVLWLNDHGNPFINVWKDGAHEALRLREGETEEELLARIQAAVEALKNQTDPNQSLAMAGGATSTGIIPPEGAEVSNGPAPDAEEILGAERGANTLAYAASITNYGPDVTVTGANNRFSMSLDFGIAGSRLIDQVGARMQPIRYYWELIEVTNVRQEEREERARETAVGDGDMAHPISGVGTSLERDFAAIEEDTQADVNEAIDDPYLAVTWPARLAYLELIGLSNRIRMAGSVISSFVSILSQPSNELNVGWDREGEFLLRCVATPVSEEGAAVRRASSVATKAIRIININDRATELVNEEANRLSELREQATAAPEGPERDLILQQIEQIETRQSQTSLERIDVQLTNLNQQIAAVEEIGTAESNGTPYEQMSHSARLIRVNLELRGVDRQVFLTHLREQRRLLLRMQSFGTEQVQGMRPPIYRPGVVLVSEENGQSYPLMMMLGQATGSSDGNWHYKLVNLTDPGNQNIYEGRSRQTGIAGHNEAIRKAFVDFRENNGYGRGTIAIRLPENMPEGIHIESTMRSAPGSGRRFERRLQDLATAAEIAALFVGGPVGVAIGLAGGVAGAVVAIRHISDRVTAGRFEWDFETFMDVSAIIGGALPFAGLSRRMGRFVYFVGIAQLGQSVLVIPYQLERQLREIELAEGLSPGERSARRAEAFLQAIRSGVVTAISAAQMLSEGPPEAASRRPEAEVPDAPDAPDGESPGSHPVETDVTPADIEAATGSQEDAPTRTPESRAESVPTTAAAEPSLSQAGRLEQHRSRLREELAGLDPDSPAATLLRLEIADINQVLDHLGRTDVDGETRAAILEGADQLLGHLDSINDSPTAERRTHDVDPLPEATVMQPADPTDAASANTMYENSVAESPTREAAIYRNPETGEIIVVQGDEGTVFVDDTGGQLVGPEPGGRAQRWKELLEQGQDRGRWELQAHYHPIEGSTGTVSPANRLPSGANGDFAVLMAESQAAGGEARSSRIDFSTPNGMESTIFSFRPGSPEPFVIDFPDPVTGQRERLSFRSLEAYHEYMMDTHGIDLGPIDPQLSGTPGPAHPAPEGAVPHAADDAATPSSREARRRRTLLEEQSSLVGERTQLSQERAALSHKIDQINGLLEERAQLAREASSEAGNTRMREILREIQRIAGDDFEINRIGDAIEAVRELSQERAALDQRTREVAGRLGLLDQALNPEQYRALLPCFTADTLVWTPDGRRAISSLSPGEQVLTYDFEKQEVVAKSIQKLHRNKSEHYYEIEVKGTKIRATGQHPFYEAVEDKWMVSSELTTSQKLFSPTHEHLPIEQIQKVEVDLFESFNLAIADNHNYFVGPGVLAHNSGATLLPDGSIDLGLSGPYIIYRGSNPAFPDLVYIGQSMQDSDASARQAQERRQGESFIELHDQLLALVESEGPAYSESKNRIFESLLRAIGREARRYDPSELRALADVDRPFFEFSRGVVLEVIVRGIATSEQASYLEQININLELRLSDPTTADQGVAASDTVMNRREQARSSFDQLEETVRQQLAGTEFCP